MTFSVCKFKRVGKIKFGVKAQLLLTVFQQMLTEMLIFFVSYDTFCKIKLPRFDFVALIDSVHVISMKRK